MRFNPQSWNDPLTSQVLVGQRLVPLASAQPAQGSDYCVWLPSSSSLVARVLAKDPEMDVNYALRIDEAQKLSAPSITFELKTFTGVRLATLQCFFPKADPLTRLPFDRWTALAGPHITIETRP